jgi:cytochrome c553
VSPGITISTPSGKAIEPGDVSGVEEKLRLMTLVKGCVSAVFLLLQHTNPAGRLRRSTHGDTRPVPTLSILQGVPVVGRNQISIAVLVALLANAAALAAVSTARLEQRARSAMRLTADPVHGQLLYARNCADCHGAQAHGDTIRLIPALAGQRRAYLIKHVAELNDAERAAAHMHPKLESVELAVPQAWADLATYLRQCAPLEVASSSNQQLVMRGARSYRRWCAACHGSDATGDDDEFVPALRDQRREYLLKELRMVAAVHRLSVRSDVMVVLDSLNAESTAGIADYVSGIEVTQN